MQPPDIIITVAGLLILVIGTRIYVSHLIRAKTVYRTPSEIGNFDSVTESLKEAQKEYDAVRPNRLLDMETQPQEEQDRMTRLVGNVRKTKRKYSKRKYTLSRKHSTKT